MTNLFRLLDFDIWDFIGIWCLGFEISEVLNPRDIVSKDCPSIEYSTVKFHIKFQRSRKYLNPSTLNGERRTFEPHGFRLQRRLYPQASSLIEEKTFKFR